MKFIEAVETFGKDKRFSWLGLEDARHRYGDDPKPIEPGKTASFQASPQRNFSAKNLVVSKESEPLLIVDVKQGNQSFTVSVDPIPCNAFVMEKFENNLPERTKLHLMPVTEVGVRIELMITNPTKNPVRFEGAFFGEVSEGHDWAFDEEMRATLLFIKATELGPIACFHWEHGIVELPIPAERVGELMDSLGRSVTFRLPFQKKG